MDVLIFSVDEHLYALAVAKVVRVLWALEITPLPESPPIVCGVFDLHGKTIPVISLRRLLSLPQKDLELEDTFIIVMVHGHQMSLLCDHVLGVFALEEEDAGETQELFPQLALTHIIKYDERVLPMLDIDGLIDRETLHGVHKEMHTNHA